MFLAKMTATGRVVSPFPLPLPNLLVVLEVVAVGRSAFLKNLDGFFAGHVIDALAAPGLHPLPLARRQQKIQLLGFPP